MRIGLDIDGVISDPTDEMIHRLALAGIEGVHVSDLNFFKMEDNFDVSPDWMGKQMADPVFWLNQKPYEDAWTCVNRWFSQGHDIFLITSRWHEDDKWTYRWFEEWDIPYNMLFSSVGHTEKYKVAQELECHFVVDDRITEVSSYMENGVNTFLMDRPWNQGETDAYRTKSFYEIDKVLVNNAS